MLAIDVPSSVFIGFVFAQGGKELLKTAEPEKVNFVRRVVLMFTAIFYTPVPLIFLNGWPAWQTNYVMPWADNMVNHPVRAFAVALFFALTVLPAYFGLECGRCFIQKGRESLVKVGIWTFVFITALIIYLTRQATFNVAPDYTTYEAGIFFPISEPHFLIPLIITSLYTWGSLFLFYRWIRKKSRLL